VFRARFDLGTFLIHIVMVTVFTHFLGKTFCNGTHIFHAICKLLFYFTRRRHSASSKIQSIYFGIYEFLLHVILLYWKPTRYFFPCSLMFVPFVPDLRPWETWRCRTRTHEKLSSPLSARWPWPSKVGTRRRLHVREGLSRVAERDCREVYSQV
jgi:predicted membrane protein